MSLNPPIVSSFKKHKHFLSFLLRQKQADLALIIPNLKNETIIFICELYKNLVLNENIYKNDKHFDIAFLKKTKKHRNKLLKICRAASVDSKRKILTQSGSGIFSLLKPVFNILSELFLR